VKIPAGLNQAKYMVGELFMQNEIETDAVQMPKLDLEAGRRAFLRTSGLMAAGAAVLGMGVRPGMAEAAAAITDPTILNFALNLEYLEAEFYLRAAFGRGLMDADVTGKGKLGTVMLPKGTRVVNYPKQLSPMILKYAKEIAADEEHHVKLLRTALGSAAVARPTINLDSSFTAAARAAGLISSTATFNPYDNDTSFLLAAFIFEDVGVTAYKGAARLIKNPDVLEAAAGLLAVEAYHAGAVRTLLISRGLFDASNRISDVRDGADGPADMDQGVGSAGKYNVVPTDANGLAFSRTPAQVLNIVYLGAQASSVSFFPNRLNGEVC
jgi:hypothetical protein